MLENEVANLSSRRSESQAKRARTEAPGSTIDLWVNLAKLYHALGDYDTMTGIFSQKKV